MVSLKVLMSMMLSRSRNVDVRQGHTIDLAYIHGITHTSSEHLGLLTKILNISTYLELNWIDSLEIHGHANDLMFAQKNILLQTQNKSQSLKVNLHETKCFAHTVLTFGLDHDSISKPPSLIGRTWSLHRRFNSVEKPRPYLQCAKSADLLKHISKPSETIITIGHSPLLDKPHFEYPYSLSCVHTESSGPVITVPGSKVESPQWHAIHIHLACVLKDELLVICNKSLLDDHLLLVKDLTHRLTFVLLHVKKLRPPDLMSSPHSHNGYGKVEEPRPSYPQSSKLVDLYKHISQPEEPSVTKDHSPLLDEPNVNPTCLLSSIHIF
jgi:hypothetical protein